MGVMGVVCQRQAQVVPWVMEEVVVVVVGDPFGSEDQETWDHKDLAFA